MAATSEFWLVGKARGNRVHHRVSQQDYHRSVYFSLVMREDLPAYNFSSARRCRAAKADVGAGVTVGEAVVVVGEEVGSAPLPQAQPAQSQP